MLYVTECSVKRTVQKVTGHWAKIRGAARISCLELICHYMLLIYSQLVDLEGGAVSIFNETSWSRAPPRYVQDRNILKAYDPALMEISFVSINSFLKIWVLTEGNVKNW